MSIKVSQEEENEEDSGYGIYYSEDEITIDSTAHALSVDMDDDDSSTDESPVGLFGCNKKILGSNGKATSQKNERWTQTPDSSYSSSSEKEDDDSSQQKRCFYHHRSHKSEGEISALIASLISFSTAEPSYETETSKISKARPRSNTLPVHSTSAHPKRSTSCLPSIWPLKEPNDKSGHGRKSQYSPITLLPSLNSSCGSFSSIATFFNSEMYSEEEMVMLDGDLPTPDSDLSPRIVPREVKEEEKDGATSSGSRYLKCRSFHVVTTAALPWMTGTAVNPLLRAVYLNQMNRKAVQAFMSISYSSSLDAHMNAPWEYMGTVTLVIPWLIHRADRQELYGLKYTFDSPSEQESYIRSWLEISAKVPLEAHVETHGIRIV